MSSGHTSTGVSAETLDDLITVHREFLAGLDSGGDILSAVAHAYGWDIDSPVPEMVVAQIDQIVIRRLNDFVPEVDRPFILDCGANIGISALNYRRWCPDARIIAFEADPAIFGVLRRNLDRNHAADVQAIEAAVWTAAGEIPFSVDGMDGGRIDRDPGASGRRLSVPAIDLTAYLDQPVDMLKLDIEGAEYAVVAHVLPSLTSVKNVAIECHIDQSTVSAFGTLLTQLHGVGFDLTFNTFGSWRDLIRRSPIQPPYSEQYVAVYGTRSAPAASRTTSWLPYIDIQTLLHLYRAHESRRGPRDYQRSLADVIATLGSAVTLERPFVPNGGRAWVARLPESVPDGDDLPRPTASTLFLFEDGKPIGPPHSEHAAIRQSGAGRYSHWRNLLYFSTSDDSDPNQNGRIYAFALAAD